MKLFSFVDRKEEYEKVKDESSESASTIKSAELQYKEKATQLLNCTELTNSVCIDYIEAQEDGKGTRTIRGHATRKRDGWFCVDFVSTPKDFKV